MPARISAATAIARLQPVKIRSDAVIDGPIGEPHRDDVAGPPSETQRPQGVADRAPGAQSTVRHEGLAATVVPGDEGAVVEDAVAFPVVIDRVAEAQRAGEAGIAQQVESLTAVRAHVAKVQIRNRPRA